MLLKDKVVLVLDAETSLGNAIAINCARHGAHVAINADPMTRQAAETLSAVAALGRRGLCLDGQATEASGAETLVADVVLALGRIDVLIGCPPSAPSCGAPSTPMQTLRRAGTMGVTGLYAVLQAAARRMSGQDDGGAIIAVSAAGPDQDFAAVAHAETQDLMQMWAETLRHDAIRCNVVRLDPPSTDARDHRDHALEDLTGPVMFLASDLARNVSGSIIHVGEPAARAALDA